MPADNFIYSTVDHMQQRINYASSTINYVGLASPGARTSDPVWQIKRITKDSQGRTTAVEFADRNANFDNIFDNAATLSYS